MLFIRNKCLSDVYNKLWSILFHMGFLTLEKTLTLIFTGLRSITITTVGNFKRFHSKW